ncbi:MAG TPA: DinB family protein [Pyrinomonadaceae bacterium]|jgi:hypothetical protein|nr:DinB family protein [Pyrinomonadaceae bacterium]
MIDQETLEALLDFLDETPNKFAGSISRLSPTETRWKNSDAEFSVLENLCHLRDLELQGYTLRIERILSETEPILADFDGARVAAESDYNSEPADLALAAFASTRRENVRILRSLSADQLEREGLLEGLGKVTLRQIAEKMREHDEGHLEDLRVLRQQLERRPRAG